MLCFSEILASSLLRMIRQSGGRFPDVSQRLRVAPRPHVSTYYYYNGTFMYYLPVESAGITSQSHSSKFKRNWSEFAWRRFISFWTWFKLLLNHADDLTSHRCSLHSFHVVSLHLPNVRVCFSPGGATCRFVTL